MTLQRGNGLAKRRQAAALLKSGAMTIAAGTKLGRYEIRSKIGAGGMGEVYLAQETQKDIRPRSELFWRAELAL